MCVIQWCNKHNTLNQRVEWSWWGWASLYHVEGNLSPPRPQFQPSIHLLLRGCCKQCHSFASSVRNFQCTNSVWWRRPWCAVLKTVVRGLKMQPRAKHHSSNNRDFVMEPYNGFQTMCIKFQNSTLQMIVLYLFMSNQVDFNKIQWFSSILSLLEKKMPESSIYLWSWLYVFVSWCCIPLKTQPRWCSGEFPRVARHTGAASCPDTSQPMVLERRRRAETNRIHWESPLRWLTVLSWHGENGQIVLITYKGRNEIFLF